MTENTNVKTQDFYRAMPSFGTGKRDNDLSLILTGTVAGMNVGKTKAGETMVRLAVNHVMHDKNVKYWSDDQVVPHADHSVRVEVVIMHQGAQNLINHPPLFGQKVLVQIDKAKFDQFKKRDGTEDWKITGLSNHVCLMYEPDSVGYFKKVAGSDPTVYEYIKRKPITVYDFEGKPFKADENAGAVDGKPAPKAGNGGAANPAPANPLENAILNWEELDDDSELPF